MAKQRYVRTSFRSDNYIETLDLAEKAIFLYFLTNEQTNISGVYEITLKRIMFDTGADKELLTNTLKKFSDDEKIWYIEGYIVIKNHLKNQNLNPSTVEGAKREIKSINGSVLTKIQAVCRLYPVWSTLLNLTLPNLTLLGDGGGEENLIIVEKDETPLPPNSAPPPSPSEKADSYIKRWEDARQWMIQNDLKPTVESRVKTPKLIEGVTQAIEMGVSNENIQKAIQAYAIDIKSRGKDAFHYNHRYNLADFLTNPKGLQSFI